MKSVNECTFRRFFLLCTSEELLHLKFLVLELLEFLVLLVLAVMSVMTVGVVAVAVRMSCYYNSFWRHVTMLHHHWLSRRVHPWLHHHGLPRCRIDHHGLLHAGLHHHLRLGLLGCALTSSAACSRSKLRLEVDLSGVFAAVSNLEPLIDSAVDTEG